MLGLRSEHVGQVEDGFDLHLQRDLGLEDGLEQLACGLRGPLGPAELLTLEAVHLAGNLATMMFIRSFKPPARVEVIVSNFNLERVPKST